MNDTDPEPPSSPPSSPESQSAQWFYRLQEDFKDKQDYGYAVYYHPGLLAETRLGKIRARHDLQFDRSERQIRVDVPLYMALQVMRWPSDIERGAMSMVRHTRRTEQGKQHEGTDEEAFSSADDDTDESIDDFAEDPVVDFDLGRRPIWHKRIERKYETPGGHDYSGLFVRDASPELRKTFQELREDFRSFRSKPKIKSAETYVSVTSGYHDGLYDSILDSCFIVLDPYSAFTWWDADDSGESSWVWVVDADYEEITSDATADGLTEQYRGYLRVRLRQLNNKFFEARYYRQDISMEDLWKLAKQQPDFAFDSSPKEQISLT